MSCTRCNGLMVVDDLLDMKESYLPMWMRGHRCVVCGNIEDPLIHYHRALQQARKTRRISLPSTRLIARPAQAA